MCLCHLLSVLGLPVPAQVVVPQGIESVNGSAVDMGCTSLLVDSGGVMVCGGCGDPPGSYLVDGKSPAFDTESSDWASQLVTVRRIGATELFPFTHVLLTFAFDTAVSLTGIGIDLFLCPDWNIGAPSITIYADMERNLDLASPGLPTATFSLNNLLPSCDSLISTNLTFTSSQFRDFSYSTWHILAPLLSTEWFHVGEVRFLGTSINPAPSTNTQFLFKMSLF